LDRRKACSGPGWIAAANAKPIPMTKYSGTLAGEYRIRPKKMSRTEWANGGLGGYEISLES